MLEIKNFILGSLATNGYLLWDNQSKDCVVVDPGGECHALIQTVQEKSLHPLLIVNTHGHGDHIAGNAQCQKALGCPIAIHAADAVMLADPDQNLSGRYFLPVKSPGPDFLLEDGQALQMGSVTLKIIWIPGHSPGSIGLVGQGMVVTGDALFYESIGRTDLPGGNSKQLLQSLMQKVFTLPDDFKVFPGHGPATHIAHEKAGNPFFRGVFY